MPFLFSIPSSILGANFATFGSLYDPIGPSIGANLAAAAFFSPGIFAAGLAQGQVQAQGFINQFALSGFSSGSVYDSLGILSNIVNFAQSPFF